MKMLNEILQPADIDHDYFTIVLPAYPPGLGSNKQHVRRFRQKILGANTGGLGSEQLVNFRIFRTEDEECNEEGSELPAITTGGNKPRPDLFFSDQGSMEAPNFSALACKTIGDGVSERTLSRKQCYMRSCKYQHAISSLLNVINWRHRNMDFVY
jgi:hypothetical protein